MDDDILFIFTKNMLSSNNVLMIFFGIHALGLNETTSFIGLGFFIASIVLFGYFALLSYFDTENKNCE